MKRLLPSAFVVLMAPAMAHADEMRFNLSGRVGLRSFADAVTDQSGGTSLLAGYRPFAAISDNGRFLAGSTAPSVFTNASEHATCVGDWCLATVSRVSTGPFLRRTAVRAAILDLDRHERLRTALEEWPSRVPEGLSGLRGDPKFWAAMWKCRRASCRSEQPPNPGPIHFRR